MCFFEVVLLLRKLLRRIFKFSQITKNIQNLFQAAKEKKLESYLNCAENILDAVKEIVVLFPEVMFYDAVH